MRDKKIFIVVFLCVITFLSCKENKSDNSSELQTKQENLIQKNGYVPFVNEGDDFTYGNYKLVFNKSNGNFTLSKNGKNLGEVQLGDINYDGPGFKAYINEQKQAQNIIIEATADIGTAWYYSVVLQNDLIADQFLIEEPRSDSEKYGLDQFMTFTVSGDSVKYGFKKSLIAKYSKIPKDLSSDQDYLYLIRPLKKTNNEKIQENGIVDGFIKEMSKDYQLVDNQSHDINSDGIEDKFLVLKNKKEFNSDDDSSKKSIIAIFLSNNGSFKKFINSAIFPNNANDQFDKLSFRDKDKFVIQLFNEIPGQYFIEKNMTFKYKNQNFVLEDYSITKGDERKNTNLSKMNPVYFENFNADNSVFK